MTTTTTTTSTWKHRRLHLHLASSMRALQSHRWCGALRRLVNFMVAGGTGSATSRTYHPISSSRLSAFAPMIWECLPVYPTVGACPRRQTFVLRSTNMLCTTLAIVRGNFAVVPG